AHCETRHSHGGAALCAFRARRGGRPRARTRVLLPTSPRPPRERRRPRDHLSRRGFDAGGIAFRFLILRALRARILLSIPTYGGRPAGPDPDARRLHLRGLLGR